MSESEQAFEQLKNALMSPPILSMPNLEEKFIIECDASKVGIGVVLMQKDTPGIYQPKIERACIDPIHL